MVPRFRVGFSSLGMLHEAHVLQLYVLGGYLALELMLIYLFSSWKYYFLPNRMMTLSRFILWRRC